MTTTVYKGSGTTVTLDTTAGTITLKHGMGAGPARYAERHQVLLLADLDRVEEATKGWRTDLRLVVFGATPTMAAADDPLAFRMGFGSHKPFVALIDAELARIGRVDLGSVETSPPLKPSTSLRAEADAKSADLRPQQRGGRPGVFEPFDAKPAGGGWLGGGGGSWFGGGGE